MAYSRRGLGLGLTALGGALIALGVSEEVSSALTPCGGLICFSAAEMLKILLVEVILPGLVMLAVGLYFFLTSRTRPWVSGRAIRGS